MNPSIHPSVPVNDHRFLLTPLRNGAELQFANQPSRPLERRSLTVLFCFVLFVCFLVSSRNFFTILLDGGFDLIWFDLIDWSDRPTNQPTVWDKIHGSSDFSFTAVDIEGPVRWWLVRYRTVPYRTLWLGFPFQQTNRRRAHHIKGDFACSGCDAIQYKQWYTSNRSFVSQYQATIMYLSTFHVHVLEQLRIDGFCCGGTNKCEFGRKRSNRCDVNNKQHASINR